MSMDDAKWYRIDKGDGAIVEVNENSAMRAAAGYYRAPSGAVKIGRFSTPFAIYTRGDHATTEEQNRSRETGDQRS